MRAGMLDKRVSLQRATEAVDTTGQLQPTWATLTTLYAGIRGPSAKEQEAAKQMEAIVTHVVTTRYQGDTSTPESITNNPRHGDRFLYGTRVLNVLGVVDWDNAHVELRSLCAELASGS